MKYLMTIVMLLAFVSAAYPQTVDQGMGAFSNDKGPILLAVDASLINLAPGSPYVMFVVYMAAKSGNQNIVVSRDGVVMVYNGQELKMPSFEELRKNYGGEIRDITFYRQLGKEGLIASWMRIYDFPQVADFFPPMTAESTLSVDEGSMYDMTGFRTKCYFKNPGFKKGDSLVIRVTAKNKPELVSEVTVTLK